MFPGVCGRFCGLGEPSHFLTERWSRVLWSGGCQAGGQSGHTESWSPQHRPQRLRRRQGETHSGRPPAWAQQALLFLVEIMLQKVGLFGVELGPVGSRSVQAWEWGQCPRLYEPQTQDPLSAQVEQRQDSGGELGPTMAVTIHSVSSWGPWEPQLLRMWEESAMGEQVQKTWRWRPAGHTDPSLQQQRWPSHTHTHAHTHCPQEAQAGTQVAARCREGRQKPPSRLGLDPMSWVVR